MHPDFRAYDLLHEAHLVLDENYCVVFANRKYLSTIGESADAIVGRNVYTINQHGDLKARRERQHLLDTIFAGLRMANTVDAGPLEYPPTAQDPSSPRWWRTHATRAYWNLATEGGAFYVIRVSDVTGDVTSAAEMMRDKARLRSQAQLRKRMVEDAHRRIEVEEQTLKSALEFAKIGAWTIHISTGRISCSSQCKANFGVPESAELDMALLRDELIAPGDFRRMRNILSASLRTGSTYEIEFEVIWPNGERRWIMALGNLAADLQTSGYVSGFTLDITARKLHELHNAEVLRQETAARIASEKRVATIDTFVSSVSHELRSPLNAISNWIGLLRYPERISLDQVESVITRNITQLSRLVDDLLDTGAILNERLSMSREPLDLALLVSRVVEDARPAIEDKNLNLLKYCYGSYPVFGDAARLQQVLFNLLTNATKFTQSGSIVVSLEEVEMHVRLIVGDTGQGIPAERQATIFERFDRGDVNGLNGIEGLGLGLWLVRRIVAAHGGTVGVYSAGPGQGSTFTVALPLSNVLLEELNA